MSQLPLDTSPEAAIRQLKEWRRMTPQERAALANQMSIDVTGFAVAGIRAQLPGASEERVRHELARRRFGRDLADAAFGPMDGE
jgi:hypothetical protein